MKRIPTRSEERGFSSPCWIWQGKLSPRGYGPYRNIYRKHKGEIPAGLHLDHLCRVPACCNPDHLQPVTPEENIRRRHPFVRDGALTKTEPPFWLSRMALDYVEETTERLGVSQAAVIEMAVRKLTQRS